MEILAFDMSELLTKAVHILYVALGLGLVIFFHELGHFAVAKWCGVFVERFSIGFGPILCSFKRGDTEYALSLIPFGGYVKMLGQDDMDPSQLTTEEIAQDPRAYSAKNVPQRMGIISAGVIMNVITGMLFFGIAFRLGVDSSPSVVGHAVVGKPAWEKGIRSGDVFTRINGRETKSFQDILRGTTLSRGDIQIEGHHADGETFKVVIQPDASGLRRMIGVSDARSLKVAEIGNDVKTTVVPGSPAEAVKDAFREDSLIVSFDGTPIETYAQLQTLLARHRSEVIDLGIKQGDEVRSVLLKPARFREVGLWMDIEQIAAIQDGSPAAKGGLKVGDKITSVNGVDVGKAINPLHLAEHLEMLAGQEVEIRVKRTVEGSPKLEEVTVKLTPDDTPAWIEYPFSDGTPLGIPSIGVAYHLTSNVLKVLPDSPAAKAGVPEGGVLESVKIESDDETYNKIFADKSIELKFVDPTKKSMAFALWQFQEVPDAKVTLKFKGDVKQYEIKPVPSKEEWYIAQRGIFLQPQSQLLIADTWGDAFRMGVYQTQNTGLDIYMTLRNLISRDLSPQNLSGPVGIAKVAYAVSKQGIPQLLMFLGFLSINLAILNFLPIPVLDGGHMVFLIWEGVTRRKPSEKVLIAASYVGMAFVLGLMLFVIYLDIFVHGSRG
ncbi:MAG: site-2 protease family protein [Planctomycetota bacterium]|nr:site-2 protease family protein [Planctomycetota bacterium]MDA0920042.1 site-2 protease family protein [Planctomycetota bacterium]